MSFAPLKFLSVANHCPTERYFVCHEREHCTQYGNRFCICFTSMSTADPGVGRFQRVLCHVSGSERTLQSYFQFDLSTMGFGHCYSLRIPAVVHVWRREEQLFQGGSNTVLDN